MVSYRALLVFILALALATAAAAQPTETCAGADLDGSQTFTFSGDLSVTTDDFTLPVTCNELGPDSVVCFTPTNGCTVNVGCERDSGNQSVNMFTGSCSPHPLIVLSYDAGGRRPVAQRCRLERWAELLRRVRA